MLELADDPRDLPETDVVAAGGRQWEETVTKRYQGADRDAIRDTLEAR